MFFTPFTKNFYRITRPCFLFFSKRFGSSKDPFKNFQIVKKVFSPPVSSFPSSSSSFPSSSSSSVPSSTKSEKSKIKKSLELRKKLSMEIEKTDKNIESDHPFATTFPFSSCPGMETYSSTISKEILGLEITDFVSYLLTIDFGVLTLLEKKSLIVRYNGFSQVEKDQFSAEFIYRDSSAYFKKIIKMQAEFFFTLDLKSAAISSFDSSLKTSEFQTAMDSPYQITALQEKLSPEISVCPLPPSKSPIKKYTPDFLLVDKNNKTVYMGDFSKPQNTTSLSNISKTQMIKLKKYSFDNENSKSFIPVLDLHENLLEAEIKERFHTIDSEIQKNLLKESVLPEDYRNIIFVGDIETELNNSFNNDWPNLTIVLKDYIETRQMEQMEEEKNDD